jgi:hypothetical protein
MTRSVGLFRRGVRGGAVVALCAVFSGCQTERADSRLTRIQELEDRVQKQARRLVDQEEELSAAARTIQELRGLEGSRRLERLVHVARIEIERLSGGYDDNRDGVDDGVVVYIQPKDADGDVIKAAGSVKVEIFDVTQPSGPQVIGKVELSPDATRKAWFSKLLGAHYRIQVPWAADALSPERSKVTVTVHFTDLLSGETFEAHHIADVRKPARPTVPQ